MSIAIYIIAAILLMFLLIIGFSFFKSLAITAIAAASLYFLTPANIYNFRGAAPLGCRNQDFIETFKNAPKGFKHEAEVRHIFNCLIDGGEFIEVSKKNRTHLDWLYIQDEEGGYKTYLDLDGYNADAAVAFEYQGILHYQPMDKSGKSVNQYLIWRKNDDAKIKLAAENGIDLIIIHCDVPLKNMFNYVRSRLFDIGKLKEKYQADKDLWYMDVIPEPERYLEEAMDKVVVSERKSGNIIPLFKFSSGKLEKI